MTLYQSQRRDMSKIIATKKDIVIISEDSLPLVPFRMYVHLRCVAVLTG